MEKDHMMEKREPHDAINLFKEVQEKILFLRNQEVILDVDVAQLYGVETREVNQAVRNNPNKFPNGYVFEIDKQELIELRSKFITPKVVLCPKLLQRKACICLPPS